MCAVLFRRCCYTQCGSPRQSCCNHCRSDAPWALCHDRGFPGLLRTTSQDVLIFGARKRLMASVSRSYRCCQRKLLLGVTEQGTITGGWQAQKGFKYRWRIFSHDDYQRQDRTSAVLEGMWLATGQGRETID